MEVVQVAPGHVVLVGRLDTRCLGSTREVLLAALDDPAALPLDGSAADLVLDVHALEVWDAAGLGLLLAVHRRAARSGRRLVLAGPGPQLRRLLRASRLDRVLVVVDGVPVG